MEKKESEIVFAPYESEEDVIQDGLSFEDEFQKEERIGWSKTQVIVMIAIALVGILVIGGLIVFLPRSQGHPVINEAMSSNEAAFVHPAYGSVDWVELYNPTDRDIDMSGYGFTDEIKKQYKYTFPEGTILPAGGYLVLYCTGGTAATDTDPYCTGFALSQEGEQLYLLGKNYLELDELTLPMLDTDTAYARTDDGRFAVTDTVTPGEANRFGE